MTQHQRRKCLLCIVLGLLLLQAAWASSRLLWTWLIRWVSLVSVQPLLYYEACCEAKESRRLIVAMLKFASRQYGRHLAVTLAVVAINMFWLLPLAACVALWNVDGMLALIIACVPLYCWPSDFMLASLGRP